MIQVHEINGIDELQRHAAAWQTLLEQTAGASFFQSLEWLNCYWNHFGERETLRVLFVFDGDRPIGILPLIVATETTRLGNVRLLTYPLRDWGTFYGPIGPNPAVTLSAGLRHIASTRHEWDIVDLRWTDPRFDGESTPRAMSENGLSAATSIWKFTDLVEIRGDWDDYLASRSGKLRSNLRRSEDRAFRMGEVIYERHRPAGIARGDSEPNWPLYEECVALSSRTWQGMHPRATSLAHSSVRAFFQDSHEAAARCGAADVNVLRIGGRTAAFSYNYHFAGRLTGMRIGYDPEFSAASPGTLLLIYSLRDSFQRGDKLLDLGTNRLEYKRTWRTDEIPVLRYAHYRVTSPRSQLLRWKRKFFPQTVLTGKPPVVGSR